MRLAPPPLASRTLALLLVGGLLAACAERPPAEPFHAEALVAGEGPLRLDEALTIRFNAAVAHVPPGAVVVRNGMGRPVPVVCAPRGRHLDILVAHPRGLWPTNTEELSVQIVHPLLGRPLESRSGAANGRGFRARVPVSSEPSSNDLLLEEHPFRREASGDLVLEDFASGARDFVLRFDGPIDRRSLETGVQLVDVEEGVRLEVTPELDPEDWSRVEIPLFRDGLQILDAASRYRLVVTTALRSSCGRSPRKDRDLLFRTPRADGGRRTLRIPFREAADLGRDSGHGSAWLEHGRLRPRTVPHPILPRGVPDQPLARQAPGVTPFFRATPARLQFLVPAQEFARHGPHLLTGLSLTLERALPHGTILRDLSVTIGYLSEGSSRAGTGLSGGFASNMEPEDPLPVKVPIGGGALDLQIGEDLQLAVRDGGPAVLEIPFDLPWLKSQTRRDLVIELSHRGVRWSPSAPGALPPEDGIALLGTPVRSEATRPPHTVVSGAPDAPGGTSLPFLLGFGLEVQRIEPVVSRWYVVEGPERPEWFLEGALWEPGNPRYAAADVIIRYQGGHPRRAPDGRLVRDEAGRPVCDPVASGWSTDPPPPGTRALRIRIDFSANLLVEVERGERPEIEYVLVRYQEGARSPR